MLRVSWSIVLLAVLFIAAGVAHFIIPRPYETIVPAWLPDAPLVVRLSGVAELLGGAGLLIPLTRPAAAWGLIVLLVVVFPANVEMLRLAHAENASLMWQAGLWFRLPLQAVLIWWIRRASTRASTLGRAT